MFCASLCASTCVATSSVISCRSVPRSAVDSPAPDSRILMFTSWSEVSTPAELSMKSVLTSPPWRANSILAAWVSPRLPPSPITFARSCVASMRTASLDLSPASACTSRLAFT
jgi:hypothetical protein